jgi:hypothetical protein
MTNDNTENIKEDESYCPHYWHQTGIMLTSDPPQIQVRCCHCGIYKYIRQGESIDRSKHGQFLPNNIY